MKMRYCENKDCKNGENNTRQLLTYQKKYCSNSCSAKIVRGKGTNWGSEKTRFKKGFEPWNKNKTRSNDERINKYAKEQENKQLPKSTRDNISKTLVKKYLLREIKVWNDGLTKETDKRLESVSEKNTINRINQILENGHWHQIGKHETKLLDEQEIKNNCKIERQYAVRISPRKFYSVDGYCEETNTVYEIYESEHNNHVFKDLERENEICKKLSCDFIIIWDE